MKDMTHYAKHAPVAVVYIAPLVTFLALSTVLNMTNPLQSGPVIILVVFVLLYLFVVSAICAALQLLAAVIRMLRPASRFSLRRSYYVVSILGLAPVLLVALNTLGQLDALEIVLILLLVGLGCFYVVRRTANK
jgi:uncharacterized membrane protein